MSGKEVTGGEGDVNPESFSSATYELADALSGEDLSWSMLLKIAGLGGLTFLVAVIALFLFVGFLGGPVWLSILLISWLFV